MHLKELTQVLSAMEPVLLAAALWAVAKSGAYKRLPAFAAYLACRLAIVGPLVLLIYGARSHVVEKHFAYSTYYDIYWVGYLVGSGLALLVIQEIFTHLMRPFPGLSRYGLIAFRWVTLTSVLISLAMALYPVTANRRLLIAATSSAMRCMSILELCLLAFIILWMQTLRLSPRSREFGVALGFGLIAAADLFGSAFAFGHSTLASVAVYGSQAVVTLGVAIWMIYFVRPETEAGFAQIKPSQIQRWNEIAAALSHSPPQVALTPSPGNLFLQDVEKAVDRVLEKNSVNSGL
jgi:hypothetical protein